MVALFLACWIILFWAFTGFCIYFVMIGREIPGGMSFVGKLIKWHGQGSIICLVASAVLGLALVFAMQINKYLSGIG